NSKVEGRDPFMDLFDLRDEVAVPASAEMVPVVEVSAPDVNDDETARGDLTEARPTSVSDFPVLAPEGELPRPSRVERFVLRPPVTRAGLGQLCEGFDSEDSSVPVIVKTIPQAALGNPALSGLFFAEAATFSQLEHPNLLRVLSFGVESGYYYVVAEHPGGSMLSDLIQKATERPPFKRDQLIMLAWGLSRGLEAAEALRGADGLGAMPRLIVPETIYVAPTYVAKLYDFVMVSSAERRAIGQLLEPTTLRALALCMVEVIVGERPSMTLKGADVHVLLRNEVGAEFAQLLVELLEEPPRLNLQQVIERLGRMAAPKMEPLGIKDTAAMGPLGASLPRQVDEPISDTFIRTKLTVADIEMPDTDVGGDDDDVTYSLNSIIPDTELNDSEQEIGVIVGDKLPHWEEANVVVGEKTPQWNEAVLPLSPHRIGEQVRSELPTDQGLPAQDRVASDHQAWLWAAVVGALCVLLALWWGVSWA
ncbi:MAG: protein kinase, partial [Myxococcota bacterium]